MSLEYSNATRAITREAQDRRDRRRQSVDLIRGRRVASEEITALPSQSCESCGDVWPGQDLLIGDHGPLCSTCFTDQATTQNAPALLRISIYTNLLLPIPSVTVIGVLLSALALVQSPIDVLSGRGGLGWPIVCFAVMAWSALAVAQSVQTPYTDESAPWGRIAALQISRAICLMAGTFGGLGALFAMIAPYL